MNDQREYTIDGTTYYCACNSLYYETGEMHGIGEPGEHPVDEHPFHLIDGDVVRVEVSDIHISGSDGQSAVKWKPIYVETNQPKYYSSKADFDPVPALERVKPNGIWDCPNCDSWAGSKEENDEPRCYRCGHNVEGYDGSE